MSVLYHPSKANVVVDTLSRLLMISIAHIEYSKKELVRDLYRLAHLGVCLVHFEEGGIIVRNSLESSLMSDMKAKKDLDPTLVELKEVVLIEAIKAFSQGEMVCFVIKVIFVFQMLMS
ncbi:hypothetical protein MTR67_052455 [Solanum verrucosum]|uniref:Uncharacterized protein n=1 Tax=Solanum verrucosum TaxID=315347 RepID=A0AAF0V6Z1_SOLVR|nr:hypothetical protein MTR67_052455 [Solanum verrucosum]